MLYGTSAIPRINPPLAGYVPSTPVLVFTGISGSFGNPAGWSGYSLRLIIPPSLIDDAIAGKRQFQFKLYGDSGTLPLRHVAFEKQAVQGGGVHEYDTAANPVEVLFGGASGASGSSPISDWVELPRAAQTADTFVVIIDVGTGSARIYADSNVAGTKTWYASGQQTYADAVPVGGTWNSQAPYVPIIHEIWAR